MLILLFHGGELLVEYLLGFVIIGLVLLALIVWLIQRFVAEKK